MRISDWSSDVCTSDLAGEKPSKGAVTAIMRAIQLVPQSTHVRFNVGRQLVIEKDLALARKVLAPVLFSPHNAQNESLAKVAGLFDEKASPEAILKAMDEAQWGRSEKRRVGNECVSTWKNR